MLAIVGSNSFLLSQKEKLKNIKQNQSSMLVNLGEMDVLVETVDIGPDLITHKRGWLAGNATIETLPEGFSPTGDLLEDCIRLWRKEGNRFLLRLNGSFNLLLIDKENGKVLVSSDRFNSYPLWLAKFQNGYIVSTFYNLISKFTSNDIDNIGFWAYAARVRGFSNRTILKDITALKEATCLEFSNTKETEETKWHNPVFEPDQSLTVTQWARMFNENLERVVNDHLKDFTNPALLLGGGIDSRLIAAFCPEKTTCFTVADSRNREMTVAAKIADICNLKHVALVRNKDWYPDMMQEAVSACHAMWRWNNSHFLPLKNYGKEWNSIDCAVMGLWFDTYFKGYEQIPLVKLFPKEIRSKSDQDDLDFMLRFESTQCNYLDDLKYVMKPNKFDACRKEYESSFRDELEQILNVSKSLGDVWEFLQISSICRKGGYPNILTLRKISRLRNIVFDNKFYEMYFKIPAQVRRSGEIIRRALWLKNKKLASLMDSNSWIPAIFPGKAHENAMSLRSKLSRVRNYFQRISRSKGYRSQGSWPQLNLLWSQNPKMIQAMDTLLKEPPQIICDYFNIDRLREFWGMHKTTKGNYVDIISCVIGLSFFNE